MIQMLQTYSQYFIAIGFAGFALLFAFIFMDEQRKKNKQLKVLGKEKGLSKEARFNQVAQRSYNMFMKIPGLKKFVQRIRKRIETLSVYDEYTLRREVMKIIFAIFSVATLIILLIILIRPSWLVAFWVLLGMLFISGVLIDFFVHRVEARMLVQIKEFNNRVRFFYQQTKMVEDAIFNAIVYVGPEMKIQAERIYDILTAVEPKKELSKYEEVAPSRFLKVIAGISLLVIEKGDKVTDKGSAYLRSLTSVNEELNGEILYRSKLSYRLRSLSLLTLVPVFFALPIQNWATDKFPIMQNFYNSRIGFLAEVIVYTTAVLCYLVIRKLREIRDNNIQMGVKRNFWEQKLFDKFPVIERICKTITPRPYTKKHFQLQKLLKDANSPNKMEWISLHRILIGTAVFIVMLSGFLYAHQREYNSTLNTTLPTTLFAGEITAEEKSIYAEHTRFDKEVIAKLQTKEIGVSEEEVKAHVAKMMGLEENDPKVLATVDRIAEKWRVVKGSFLKWWEFVIILAFVGGAAYLPIANLHFKKYLRFKEMENEVHQHLVLISSLREFESMAVYTILEWIERFSIVFKQPVQIALQDFDGGPDEALDQLAIDVSFEPFQQIIERLKLAMVRISIQEAFDDIDMERQFYIEQRKEAQERSLEQKTELGNLVGLAPLTILTFVYLIIPLIYISVVKSTETMQLIQ